MLLLASTVPLLIDANTTYSEKNEGCSITMVTKGLNPMVKREGVTLQMPCFFDFFK